MIAGHLAQGHIDGLDGVVGVNHLTDVLWEGEERDHSRPMSPPRFATTRIERIPLRGPSAPS
jgi:hypothetical protein